MSGSLTPQPESRYQIKLGNEKKSSFTLELTGCGGGKVRLYVTRFRSGYGLWLMDARGNAKQV